MFDKIKQLKHIYAHFVGAIFVFAGGFINVR